MALWNGLAAGGGTHGGATADAAVNSETPRSFEEVWRGFAANQSALRLHAEEWAWKLAEARDLAARLVEFAGKVAANELK